MKELIKKELGKISDVRLKKLALAEFLQHLVLQSLYKSNAFKNLTFTGGTALRILYKINRYSEDLDFSLTESDNFNLNKIVESVKNDFYLQNIDMEQYVNNEKTVFKADLRFPKILYEFNLSPLKDQKLSIKLEVDKNPPKGGKSEILLVTSPCSYTVAAFDLASLFATKLHAVFYRKYAKGRDYYDLIWYLGKEIKPNLLLLNNAIKQTQGVSTKTTETNFKEKLLKHLELADFKQIKKDVERFVIKQDEVEFIDFNFIKSLLRNY